MLPGAAGRDGAIVSSHHGQVTAWYRVKRRQKGRSTSQLRIIAGRWRGRRFGVPEAPGLRPTGDRVRETLFNWLAPLLPGARCLDLFAGSGALGLEALSRGAAHCDFVEREPAVAGALDAVLRELEAGNGRVHCSDARSFLADAADRYDIVFLDPPFSASLLDSCCEQLQQSGRLAGGARIYLECPETHSPEVPVSWECLREKTTGNVRYALYSAQRFGEGRPPRQGGSSVCGPSVD
jgi:16S rRNA (guanine966-N2)-methyltransferase